MMLTRPQREEIAELRFKVTYFLNKTIPLHLRIVESHREMVHLMQTHRYLTEKDRVRFLLDEIFGCSIEIQSLKLKVRRLKAEYHKLHKAIM